MFDTILCIVVSRTILYRVVFDASLCIVVSRTTL